MVSAVFGGMFVSGMAFCRDLIEVKGKRLRIKD
jgi:hypothetical protein